MDSFQDNSVQIKIKAASLNFPDLLMTQGKYQNRPNLPFALGMEGAGIVEKVGQTLVQRKTPRFRNVFYLTLRPKF